MPSIERLRDRDIFRPQFIDGLLQDHLVDHAAYYGNLIWVLTMLDNWLEEHASSEIG